MKTEKATFAAGCFWGIEQEFDKVKGVINTTVGYTGGNLKNPTYEDVCSDKTGHAEAVLVEFDSKTVSYERLLNVLWSIHDPTQWHKQGHDLGSQYRSAIFYHNERQKELAEKSLKEQQKKYQKPITTEIKPVIAFYRAEEYHQQYLEKGGLSTCHI